MDGSQLRRYAFLAITALSAILGPFLFGFFLGSRTTEVPELFTGLFDSFVDGHRNASADAQEKNLHLIVPSTGSGINFCKLLLTGGILGYPEPTVVGWNHTGIFDGSKSHLFKITETLTFLRSLPSSADEDLALILDGFDVWLQLRPSVLISGYYSILAKHDERLRSEGLLGRLNSNFDGTSTPIATKIVFGADKFAAPPFPYEAYWWAVPDSPLPKDLFGEKTDTNFETNRPKWLNSGTIIGPVKEMRDFFEATIDEILKDANTKEGMMVSDQFYFARVFGRQSVGRSILRNGKEKFMETVPGGAVVPDIPAGSRYEYGICVDSNIEIFQLGGGWDKVLGLMRFNDTEALAANGTATWKLSKSVQESTKPFAALGEDDPGHTWNDVTLASNLLTGTPAPLFHTTSAKFLREDWWPHLWFHPHAERLHTAARSHQMDRTHPEAFLEMDGIRWTQYRKLVPDQDRGGIFRANGEFLHWQDICGADEDELYQRPKV